MDVVPPVLRNFYLTAYTNVQRSHRDWWHVFECSSPFLTRIFQMRILPCDAGNLLTIDTPISETPPTPVQDDAGSDGIVTMCSHCRRVQRL
jgi:hypothetical protein